MDAKNDNPTPAKNTTMRVVIIGAVAGGAAVAARLARLNNKLNVTLIEKAADVSIASCGMPYFIGNEITDRSELLAHTPQSLQKAIGVTRVLTHTEVIKIDRRRKVVIARQSASAHSNTIDATLHEHPYDFLVIATGSAPIIPCGTIKGLEALLAAPTPTPHIANNLPNNKVTGGGVVDPTTTDTDVDNNKNCNKSRLVIRQRVLTLRNLKDMDAIVKIVKKNNGETKPTAAPAVGGGAAPSSPFCPLDVAVIGAGFIGIELMEQLHQIGHRVTLVERNPTVLPIVDDEIGAMLHPIIREKKVNLITNDSVVAIDVVAPAAVAAANSSSPPPLSLTTAGGKVFSSHLVILCVGVAAESKLAVNCGLKMSGSASSNNKLIVVDNYMRTSDPSIYAVGDVAEVSDGVFRDIRTWTPLATVAAMEARIAADHIVLGRSIPFRGTFSTAIVRCFGTAVACTGWSEKRLKQHSSGGGGGAGISGSGHSHSSGSTPPFAVSVINSWSTASYYKQAMPVLLKLTYCPTTGRLFGGQCVGATTAGVDKRIDIVATALLGNLTIHELSHGQFAYAPPFGVAKDPVTIACYNARNITFDHLTSASTRLDAEATVLDVRPQGAFERDPVTTAKPGQRKRHLFWATAAREGAKRLLAADDNNYDEGSNAASSTATTAPTTNAGKNNNNGKFQSLCFWGRTSYFAQRALVQGGVPVARLTTLQGGNVYAKALKEAENCGSKL